MKRIMYVAVVALLMAGGTAYAQSAWPDQYGSPTSGMGSDPSKFEQKMVNIEGEVKTIDLSDHTLTLQDGTQLKLPTTFEYTSLPVTGEHVQVTYDDEGGQKVVSQIENMATEGGQ